MLSLRFVNSALCSAHEEIALIVWCRKLRPAYLAKLKKNKDLLEVSISASQLNSRPAFFTGWVYVRDIHVPPPL